MNAHAELKMDQELFSSLYVIHGVLVHMRDNTEHFCGGATRDAEHVEAVHRQAVILVELLGKFLNKKLSASVRLEAFSEINRHFYENLFSDLSGMVFIPGFNENCPLRPQLKEFATTLVQARNQEEKRSGCALPKVFVKWLIDDAPNGRTI